MKFVDLLDGSDIADVKVGRIVPSSGGPVVASVRLRGTYGSGERGHAAARVLRMAVSAALAWGDPVPSGLLIDLTQLEYWGGDGLFSWLYLLDIADLEIGHLKAAILCSSENVAHISSLAEDYGDDRLSTFTNLEDAVGFFA